MSQRLGDPNLAAKLRARLRLPVIVAPMFLVSGPDLVLAATRAGVIGAMPSLNSRTNELLEAVMEGIRTALPGIPDAAPWAINLIAHATNKRLGPDLETCVRYEVPIVISSVGSPKTIIDRVGSYGGLVFSDAGSVRHARRAAEAGVDGLILLCAGAGGNTGWLNPFGFVSEVRRFFDGPVMLAGSISRGNHLHAAEMMGADLAVVGTSFIAASESMASDGYRDMLARSGADDIVLSSELTGIPANMLRESMERAGFVPGSHRVGFDVDSEIQTFKAWKDIWAAGHGVGDVPGEEPLATIVERFRREYLASRGDAAKIGARLVGTRLAEQPRHAVSIT